MKITLDYIKISNFRSFGEDQEYYFQNNGLFNIIGYNKDNDGSNGSGKSSFSLAVIVGICGPKAINISTSELKNSYLNKISRILVQVSIDDTPLLIDRVLGGSLKIKYGDNEWEEGKKEDTQNKIFDLLKLNPLQLSLLTNKAQGKYDSFLMMKDSERSDFLSSFFNLEDIEKTKDKLDSSLKELESETNELNTNILILKDRVNSNNEDIDKTKQKIEEVKNNDNTVDLKNRINEIDNETQDIAKILNDKSETDKYVYSSDDTKQALKRKADKEEQLNTEKQSIDKKISKLHEEIESLNSKVSNHVDIPEELKEKESNVNLAIKKANEKKKEKQEIENSLRKTEDAISNNKNKIDEFENEISKIQQKKQDLENKKCYACGQEVHDEKFHEIKNNLDNNIRDFNNTINSINVNIQGFEDAKSQLLDKINDLSDIDEKIDKLNVAKQGIVSEIAEYKANNQKDKMQTEIKEKTESLDSAKKYLKSLENEVESAKDSLNNIIDQKIKALNIQFTNLQREKESLQNSIKEKENSFNMLNNQLKDQMAKVEKFSNEIKDLESKHDNLEKEIGITSKASKILSRNGFIGYLFDSLLEEINNEANRNLKMIPSTRRFNIHFMPDKKAKTVNKVTKSVTYTIYSDSGQDISFKTLSGGEKTGFILSVDEAVDSVLSRRLGVKVGWKFFDELFSWMDDNNKSAILEFLSIKSQDKSYLIIDHSSEFNVSLEDNILIEKENNISTIKKGA